MLSTSIPLSSVTWTSIGPAPVNVPAVGNISGRVTGIAADPTAAGTIFLATAGGGVWGMGAGGNPNFKPLTDNQPTLFTGAIAIAPSNKLVIYAGTGEANNTFDSYAGQGVLKSTDGGVNWTLLGTSAFARASISRIVIDPLNPNIVYAAVSDGTNALDDNRGIWKSTDGGNTWSNTTTSIMTALGFSDLAIDPTNAQMLYAAVGSAAGSTLNGIYKSTDGGASWSVAGDFPIGDSTNGRIALAVAKSSPQIVYASVMNATTGALYRLTKSIDGGGHWFQLSAVPNFAGTSGASDTALLVDPTNASIVYAAGASGANSIIRSTNGGNSWTDLSVGTTGSPRGGHHALALDANGKLLDGNDGGIWRLENPTPGAVQWTNLNTASLSIGVMNCVATPSIDPNAAWGATQGAGTILFSDSTTWSDQRDTDTGQIRVDPTNQATIYRIAQRNGAGNSAGAGFIERSDNGGTSWAAKTSGIAPTDPANLYVPFSIAPGNSSRLLAGTNRLYESTNRGESWTALSSPFSHGWNSAAPIDAIATSLTDFNTIYASAGGRIFVTTNHGSTWTERDVPAYGDHFSQLYVDPTSSATAFAVRDRYSGTAAGHLFETTNGGITWIDVSDADASAQTIVPLPDIPACSFQIDPRNAGSDDDLWFVGTDAGVYVFDSANPTGWTKLAAGLPNAQVTDLDMNPTTRILTAATHGRGAWQLALNAPGSISGKVFQDFNSDGAFNAGELPMASVTVYLDANNNGTFDAGESFTTTSATGDYAFNNLVNGTYSVREISPSGSILTAPASGILSFDIINGTSFTAANFTHFPLKFTGSGTNDAFILRASPTDPNSVQVIALVNNVLTNYIVPKLSLLAFNAAFSFDGGAGDDSITVDAKFGVPYTSAGVSITGGAGNDTVIANGSSADETFDVTQSVLTTTAPIQYSQIEQLTANVAGGNDLILYHGPMTLPFSFTGSSGADTFRVLGGTYAFNSEVSAQTPDLHIDVVSGQVIINASEHLGALDLHSGGTAIMTANGNRYLETRELSIAPDTYLDMNDNDLLVDYTGGAGPYTDVDYWVTTGYSSVPQTGLFGIISTTGQHSDGSTLLALFNNIFFETTEWPPGSGNTIDASTICSKYTYFGDLNMDGMVTADDYGAIDANFGGDGPIGRAWLFGDANLDGSVTADDYGTIDANFGRGVGNPL